MRLVPEQPDDWTEPGAYPVAPGVHRIPLPLEIDGLHAVNVYAIEDESGLVVVDSGWADASTRRALASGLAEIGHGVRDISQIVVTHAHWDHYSHAVQLRDELGTPVRVGSGERHTIDAFDINAGRYPQQAVQLVACGAIELARLVAADPVTTEERTMAFGPPDAYLDDGEKIELTARTVEVLATPGHTRGHIVLRDADAELLFSGDHVLPHITPSIGLERAPERFPLRSYLDSLRLIRNQPDLLLLPAHGPVTPSAHARIDELLQHHESRLDSVAALVRRGTDNAHEIAADMPWTRRERRLSDLDVMNQMMAVLEVQAHLDVLVHLESIREVDLGDGIHRYSVSR